MQPSIPLGKFPDPFARGCACALWGSTDEDFLAVTPRARTARARIGSRVGGTFISSSKLIGSRPLLSDGEIISHREDMLSLTDMWKAGDADPSKRPVEWLRSKGARQFIDHLQVMVGNSHLFHVGAGRKGQTFAHWQIGLAYAKYLSPEFHMWCNQVVRERMEGKSLAPANISPDILEMLRRDDGMIKMLAHKVTELEKSLPTIAMQMVEPMINARLAEHNFMIRHGKTAKEIWDGHHLPPKLRGATKWLGNRLTEMGDCIDYEGRFDRGSSAGSRWERRLSKTTRGCRLIPLGALFCGSALVRGRDEEGFLFHHRGQRVVGS